MTDPTPSPILEKMARAIVTQAEAADVAVVGDNIYCGETIDGDAWLSATDLAQAALLSLLPLDEEAFEAAADDKIWDETNKIIVQHAIRTGTDGVSGTPLRDALNAFINHALGGK